MCGKTTISRRGRTARVMDDAVIGNRG
jgi:hypothetical protein